MTNLLMFFHIPRTGGTFFNHAVGDYLSPNHWQHHYNYTENSSILNLQNKDIPILYNRTHEQNKNLKILSGHSINCSSHKWIKTLKRPLYYTIVRDPVERLLSSFNYKVQKQILWQDQQAFAFTMPQLDQSALFEGKTYTDYDTLFEYYLDNTAEQNIQAKWLVKSFLDYDHYSKTFQDIKFTKSNNMIVTDNSLTTPEWFWDYSANITRELIDYAVSKFWYMSDFVNLEKDVKHICNLFDLEYQEVTHEQKNTTQKVAKHWTLEDVQNQHDYDFLQKHLALDYYLYDKVKVQEIPNDLPGN